MPIPQPGHDHGCRLAQTRGNGDELAAAPAFRQADLVVVRLAFFREGTGEKISVVHGFLGFLRLLMRLEWMAKFLKLWSGKIDCGYFFNDACVNITF